MKSIITVVTMMCIHPLPNNEWGGEWCADGSISSAKQDDGSYVYCSNGIFWHARNNHTCYIEDQAEPQ
jgi:hypothetical protein